MRKEKGYEKEKEKKNHSNKEKREEEGEMTSSWFISNMSESFRFPNRRVIMELPLFDKLNRLFLFQLHPLTHSLSLFVFGVCLFPSHSILPSLFVWLSWGNFLFFSYLFFFSVFSLEYVPGGVAGIPFYCVLFDNNFNGHLLILFLTLFLPLFLTFFLTLFLTLSYFSIYYYYKRKRKKDEEERGTNLRGI